MRRNDLWRGGRALLGRQAEGRRERGRRGYVAAVLEVLEPRLVLSAAFDVTGLTALRADSSFFGGDGKTLVDGSGVGIAVLDTGALGTNPDLKNIVAFYDATLNTADAPAKAGTAAYDKSGHGSHVSGIAASSNPDIGVAYKAKLIDVRVLGDDGLTTDNSVARGLDWVSRHVADYNIKVVNLSLGSATVNSDSSPENDSFVNAIRALEAQGVTVVGADGNNYAEYAAAGADEVGIAATIGVGNSWASDGSAGGTLGKVFGAGPHFGARETTVGADVFDATSQRSSLPNQLVAPGADIYSTWNGIGDKAHNLDSGTSMAAPFVSGVVALMQDAAYTYGGAYLSPADVLRILRASADDLVDSDNGGNSRIPIAQSPFGPDQNLPETGLTFKRVNVLRAVRQVRDEALTNNGVAVDPTTLAIASKNNDTNANAGDAIVLDALDGTRIDTYTGKIGADGLANVGAGDVDLYRVTLKTRGDLTIKLGTAAGGKLPVGAAIRFFDVTGLELGSAATSIPGIWPSLHTAANAPLEPGIYFIGVSAPGNTAYDINTGAAGGSPTATGDYVLTATLANPDPNGVVSGAVAIDLTTPTGTLTRDNAIFFQPAVVIKGGTLGSDPGQLGSTARLAVPNGDVDMFKVVPNDDGYLHVDTEAKSAYGAGGADTFLKIFDADMNVIGFNDDRPAAIGKATTDSFIAVPVVAGHTYYIAVTNLLNNAFDPVNPYGRAANSTKAEKKYDLYTWLGTPDVDGTRRDAQSVAVGQAVTGEIGNDVDPFNFGSAVAVGGKDVDIYNYFTNVAGLLDISATGADPGFHPVLTVWREPYGVGSVPTLVGSTGGGAAHMVLPAAKNETYFVAVTGLGNINFNPDADGSGRGGEMGAYVLNVTQLPVSDQSVLTDDAKAFSPGVIDIGGTVPGVLGKDGALERGVNDVDLYQFTPSVSQFVNIFTTTPGESSADTLLRLFDASGKQVAVNDDAGPGDRASGLGFDVTAGQTYYIGVSSAGNKGYNPATGTGATGGTTRGDYLLSVVSGPHLTMNDPQVLEGDSGTSSLVFTVTLDRPANFPVVVAYKTSNGGNVEFCGFAGKDYVATTGTLVIPAGQTQGTASVQIIGETAPENSEIMQLNVTGAPGVKVDKGFGTGTIINDDLVTVTVAASDAKAKETTPGSAPDTLKFHFTRVDGSTLQDLVVHYTVGGTAAGGSDYVSLPGVVTIPHGQTGVDVVVTPNDDTAGEYDESVILTVQSATGYKASAVQTAATAVGYISDNEPGVFVSQVVGAGEALVGGHTAVGSVTIQRSPGTPLNIPIVVHYVVTGSATAGTDYTALPTSVTLPAGTAAMKLSVIPTADLVTEGTELVHVELTMDGSYAIPSSSLATGGTVAIADALGVDLRVTGLTGTLASGTLPLSLGKTLPQLNLVAAIKNFGDLAMTTGLSLELHLSTDKVWNNGDDFVMGTIDVPEAILSGFQPYTDNFHITLEGLRGHVSAGNSYYILLRVIVDGTGSPKENDETNNIFFPTKPILSFKA